MPTKRSRYQKGDLGHFDTTKKTSRYQKEAPVCMSPSVATLFGPPPHSQKRVATFNRNTSQGCDPECLLQGPETSKVPKVIRRGCKRSSGPREQSPLALVQKRVAPVQNRIWVVQKTLGRPLPLGSKTPFAPSPNHLGTFEVSDPCSRHSGPQSQVISESQGHFFNSSPWATSTIVLGALKGTELR